MFSITILMTIIILSAVNVLIFENYKTTKDLLAGTKTENAILYCRIGVLLDDLRHSKRTLIDIKTGFRCSGKTDSLVRYALMNDYDIVTVDRERANNIREYIKRISIVPKDELKTNVIPIKELHKYSIGRKERGYVYDDFADALCYAFNLPEPRAISVNIENYKK